MIIQAAAVVCGRVEYVASSLSNPESLIWAPCRLSSPTEVLGVTLRGPRAPSEEDGGGLV